MNGDGMKGKGKVGAGMKGGVGKGKGADQFPKYCQKCDQYGHKYSQCPMVDQEMQEYRRQQGLYETTRPG